MRKDITSLYASIPSADPEFYKVGQSQPDEVQFAQDFSNLAFQFLQDRAPALMKYILGFEVVDRAENGTSAVGIFGFKINGDYYYVPAFFLNSQIKGIDSILSKRTNSFVPLVESWVNYIINRKASELGKEAPSAGSESKDFENPNFDFLQYPQVGPLGNGVKSAEEKPWRLSEAWDIMKKATDDRFFNDPEFKKAFVGSFLSFTGTRSPLKKEAESPIKTFIEKVGGPKAERTWLNALRNVKMANAALEFYRDPSAFHVDKYLNHGKDCYLLNKAAQEAREMSVKIEITSNPDSEAEAREVLEDGFVIHDSRDDDHKSKVVKTEYEKNFQNPDKPGIYNVLVNGGKTVEAYVLYTDIFTSGKKDMLVYFPDNNQVIPARTRDIITEGGAIGGIEDIMKKAKSINDCSPRSKYLFVGDSGSALPDFYVDHISRVRGERPQLDGSFWFSGSCCYSADPDGDFDDYWRGDRFHDITGRRKIDSFSFGTIELADFTGSPKCVGSSVILPSNWKALKIGKSDDESSTIGDSELSVPSKEDEKTTHRLGSLDSLSFELRKQGSYSLSVHSDDGQTYYMQFDGGRYTKPETYKQACVTLVTKLGTDPKDAKTLLKRASTEKKASCILKMGQLVGVGPYQPQEQTPEADPYTGIPTYQTPFYDVSTMPFEGNDPSVSEDNQLGENIGGDISRQSGGNGSGEAEFDPEAGQLAQEAAKLGQKDVFDKAAIGGLAKVYDVGAVVDSYLPDFIQSLDRIGRVLFLYYWKHNDFVQRYGTDSVIEMEEQLKSVFKNLGELTLDLKRKAVGGGDADTEVDNL